MPDDQTSDPSTDEEDPLAGITGEAERLAREAELVAQTDNGPHGDDDELPQLED